MFTPATLVRAFGCSFVFLAATALVARAAEDAEGKIDPKAQKVVDAWSKYTAGLKSFSVDSKVVLVVEQGGQKQTQDFQLKLAAERPNKLAFSVESQQGGATIVSDGKEVSAFIKSFEKYLVEKAPAGWDGLWQNPVVQGPMSFGNTAVVNMALLSDNPGKKLLEKVSNLTYDGQQDLDGKKADVISATSEEVDWKLWISAGDKPVLLQFVPDLGKAIERMAKQSKQKSPFSNLKVTNTVTFADWKLDPKFSADTFVFKAPEGIEKASSLAEIIGGGRQAERGPHPLLGQAAPEVKLDLLDGGHFDLASYKGKNVVILDFWATWCGPCTRAMPVIDKVAEKFKDKGVLLFAVNLQETPDEIKAFLEEANLKLPVVLDKEGDAAKAYKADAIPQTVIVGKDGSVQVVHIGLLPNLEEELTANLESLLAGKNLAAETLAKAKDKAKKDAPADDAKASKPAEDDAK